MTDDPTRVPVGDRVTIYQRGRKKTWTADFSSDNAHRRVSLRTTNKKVAVERATKLAAELTHGAFRPPPPARSVREAVDAYLTHLTTEDRAPRTLVKYRGELDRFVAFLAGRRVTRLGQVTASHFDAYRAARRATCSRKTVYSEGVLLKQLFKWSRTRKLVGENPLADVKLDKPPLEPKEGPSLAQVDAVLAAADEPLRSQLAVLAFTGMRSGELRRLQPGDVDLAAGWIHIRSRPGAETKTRDSRKVPIHPRLRAVLEALPATARPWLFCAAPSRYHPAGDHPVSTQRINERFTGLAGRLGLPAGRPDGLVIHSLRHFFETFSVNAGIPQRVIDAWLGHNSDKSMAAVYYRLRDEDSQAFILRVPFGAGEPAADAGGEVR